MLRHRDLHESEPQPLLLSQSTNDVVQRRASRTLTYAAAAAAAPSTAPASAPLTSRLANPDAHHEPLRYIDCPSATTPASFALSSTDPGCSAQAILAGRAPSTPACNGRHTHSQYDQDRHLCFQVDITPSLTDTLLHSRSLRHSHDLTIPITRDSIFDNILSSLDHISPAVPGLIVPLSSDHAARFDTPNLSPRLTPMSPPEQRLPQSNDETLPQSMPNSTTAQRQSDVTLPQDVSTHGRNHSLTSSIRLPKFFGGHHTSRNASVDAAATARPGSKGSNTKLVRGDSYDASVMLSDRSNNSSHDTNPASILSRGRPIPSAYSTFPTSPLADGDSDLLQGGHASPLSSNPNYPRGYNPSPASPDITTSTPTRRGLQSPKSAARERASEFVRINSSADAPSQPLSMSNMSLPPGSMQRYPNTLGDDKRGFFKRVFFSSNPSSRSNLNGDLTPSATTSPVASRSNSLAQQTPATTSPRMSPSEYTRQQRQTVISSQSSAPQLPPQQQVLNKKSSFFRRRKKSLTDSGTPPALPATMLNRDGSLPTSSSLYQAMNPYISPDLTNEATALEHQPHISEMDSNSPPTKLKVRRRNRPTSPDRQPSFVSGGSSDRQLRSADSTASPGLYSGSPRIPSPTQLPPSSGTRPELASNTSTSNLSQSNLQSEFVVSKPAPSDIPQNNRLWLRDPADDSREHTSPGRDVSLHNGRSGLNEATAAQAELGLAIHPIPDIAPVELPASQPPTRGSDTASNGLVGSPGQDEHKVRARQIYNGDESLVAKDGAAAYLGDAKPANVATLQYYIRMFDFTGKTILWALRILCDNLVLKAETQAVDRILQAFSEHWFAANRKNGFKLTDVVHTMCYSLLLLNTDLHMADIETKMTRSQFVKNTLPNIKRIVSEAAAETNDQTDKQIVTSPQRRPSLTWKDSAESVPVTTNTSQAGTPPVPAPQRPGLTKRLSSTFSGVMQYDQSFGKQVTPANAGASLLVDDPFDGKLTEWYAELEAVLKSFFTAIKHDPLPLNRPDRKGSVNLLSVGAGSVRRAPSIKSMTPSENMSMRSKRTDFHSMTSRWGKGRFGRNKMYASSTLGSSRTSFEDSSAWSRYSVGRTATTMSTDSYANMGADQSFHQSIGFANALSNAYIREDSSANPEDEEFNAQRFLLEDETLELAGAPWAKEGMVKHKYHLEAKGKKGKERDWSEGFAVIEKGYLRLFSFNSKGGKTGSLGIKKHAMPKGKAASIAPSVVGGGNWMQNAEQQACFLLRQTIASTLPPPGYSKARPHVWALSLPTGAVHLFQVGTPQIAEEFKTSANYWSARLSKEPLTGGVDNIEYGWSNNIINTALVGNSSPAQDAVAAGSAGGPRPSHDQSGTVRTKTSGDRAHVEDWKPPAQSMMASQLMAVDQLRGLKDYVHNVEKELSKHNDLRAPMDLAYSPRHSNHTKALANWEKKSAYLLREIVKFTTYTDALELAEKGKARHDQEIAERTKMREEREARQAKKAEETAAAAAAAASTIITVAPDSDVVVTSEDNDATPRQSRIVSPIA